MTDILTPETETPVVNQGDVTALFADYKEPAKVKVETEVTQPQAPQQTQPANTENWKGDPRYYQRGKKAGQLRPNNTVRVTPNPSAPVESTIPANSIITGAMLIMLIDMLIPLLITAINDKVSKQKIQAEQLQLTSNQKKELAPICDDVAKHLNLSANPMVLLTVSLVGIYGINFMVIKQQSKPVQ